MPIDSFDDVYFTCLFLLGGYISQMVVEGEYPIADDSSMTKVVLRYILFSLIISAISYPIIIISTSMMETTDRLGRVFIAAVPIGIVSYIVGYIRKQHIRHIMKKGKIIKPLLSAWDRAFYDTGAIYIKIKLKTGNEIFGCLDSSSYISDSRHPDSDILFSLCYVDSMGNWKRLENESILITRSNIEYIRIIGIIETKEGSDAEFTEEETEE